MPLTAPQTIARLSLGVSILVLGLKAWAYALTGSVSLYSDALESVVNVVAAVAVLVALRVAARPPDVNHPYGHTKAEYIAAVAEGALILFAAVEILRAAWHRLADPVALEHLGVGAAIAVVATVLNGVWATFLMRAGRRSKSPALVADGRHLWADVVSTVGVLSGIGLAANTGWWVLDPLLAIVVAGYIVIVGVRLVAQSVGGLMDESVSDAEMTTIRDVVQQHMGGAHEVHALRARHAGKHTFIEFHLVVPGKASVTDAHALCDRMEDALHQAVPDSSVTIHVEPEAKAKGRGPVVRIGTDVPHNFT